MAIYLTARFSVRPESTEKCLQAIREFVEYVKQNEPDTHFYTSMRETANPTNFLHVFSFKDEAAREKHRTSEGVKWFTSILYPELASDGVEFTEYEVVATTRRASG
jgi:quinol monooxygenase YgiN